MDWKEIKAKVEEYASEYYDAGVVEGRRAENNNFHPIDFFVGAFVTLVIIGVLVGICVLSK